MDAKLKQHVEKMTNAVLKAAAARDDCPIVVWKALHATARAVEEIAVRLSEVAEQRKRIR